MNADDLKWVRGSHSFGSRNSLSAAQRTLQRQPFHHQSGQSILSTLVTLQRLCSKTLNTWNQSENPTTLFAHIEEVLTLVISLPLGSVATEGIETNLLCIMHLLEMITWFVPYSRCFEQLTEASVLIRCYPKSVTKWHITRIEERN